MSSQSIMLIGGPDSGKTNYLARLWKALQSGSGRLKSVESPDIKYVEDALAHLLQGSFAPRSEKNIEESRRDFVVTMALQSSGQQIKIVVPDVTGELWKDAVSSSELTEEWMNQLKDSSGALLFVRVLSDLNVAPLDWVTARDLLKMDWAESPHQEESMPTQVLLCELLRFLQLTLRKRSNGGVPRVAIVITAWDRLDAEAKALGPSAYIEKQYPLFSGRLEDASSLDIKLFGTSVVAGDLEADPAFRQRFFEGDLNTSGYVVQEIDGKVREELDLTLPIAWLAED
jgi:hypothetical protein